VNEIFDPDRVDGVYAQDPEERRDAIRLDRATNYGVVRLTLLEHLNEKLYMQRIEEPDPTKWRCQILPHSHVIGVTEQDDSSLVLQLDRKSHTKTGGDAPPLITSLHAHNVFVATGYVRNAHEQLLTETAACLPPRYVSGAAFPVGRDYKVQYNKEKVDDHCGVWLQGCNESTHGVSSQRKEENELPMHVPN
jgi:L-ornithine N5-oxygenase